MDRIRLGHLSQTWSRRQLISGVGALIISGIAGCTGQAPVAEIAQSRVVYDENSVGIFVKLKDRQPSQENTATIHIELLSANNDIIGKQDRQVSPIRMNTTYIVWFENISNTEKSDIEKISIDVE